MCSRTSVVTALAALWLCHVMTGRVVQGATVSSTNTPELTGNDLQLSVSDLTVNGNNANITGDGNTVIGDHAHVRGDFSLVYGDYSTVVGDNTIIRGRNTTHVTGNNARVRTNNAHVTGDDALIHGNDAVVRGNNAVIVGNAARVTGTNVTVSGDNVTVCSDVGNKVAVTGDGLRVEVRRHGEERIVNLMRVSGMGISVTSECQHGRLGVQEYSVVIWAKEGVVVKVNGNVLVKRNAFRRGNHIRIINY